MQTRPMYGKSRSVVPRGCRRRQIVGGKGAGVVRRKFLGVMAIFIIMMVSMAAQV